MVIITSPPEQRAITAALITILWSLKLSALPEYLKPGLPFIIRKYRNRKFAILGITFFLVLMWDASNHIMGIRVFGNQRIPTESILQHLEESGLTLGAKTSSVEPDIIRNRMMILSFSM